MTDVDVERMLAYCLAKAGAWPDNPWDHDHPPVVKVGGGDPTADLDHPVLAHRRDRTPSSRCARRSARSAPMSGWSLT